MQNFSFVTIFNSFVLFGFLFSKSLFVTSSPNPAAVNCIHLNGVNFITTDAYGGQSGYCRFGSAVIEDWTLFRKNLTPAPLAISSYLSMSAPYDTAAIACSSLQGTLLDLGTQPTAPSNTVGVQICQFSDGSSIGASTLALGPQDPSNTVLTNIFLSN